MAVTFVGVVGHIRPSGGRSEGDRVSREEGEFLGVAITVVISVAFFRLFLYDDRDQAAAVGCVAAFGPDLF